MSNHSGGNSITEWIFSPPGFFSNLLLVKMISWIFCGSCFLKSFLHMGQIKSMRFKTQERQNTWRQGHRTINFPCDSSRHIGHSIFY